MSIFLFLNPIKFAKKCSYKFEFYTLYYSVAQDYFAIRLKNSSGNYKTIYDRQTLGILDTTWVFNTVTFQPDEYFNSDLMVIMKKESFQLKKIFDFFNFLD